MVLHVHYHELLDEIVDELRSIPVGFDLFVTNSSGQPIMVDAGRLPRATNIVVLDVGESRPRHLAARDLVNAGFLRPYQLILKVHTKRSPWRADHDDLPGTGDDWRRRLLEALLGDEANVRAIMHAFATRPDLGLVTAQGSLLGPDFWGDNQTVTADLLAASNSTCGRTT